MRSILIIMMLLFCASANAAIVTIDFEEYSGVKGTLNPLDPITSLDEGFVLTSVGLGGFWWGPPDGPAPQTMAIGLNEAGGVTLTQSGDAVFDLINFDLVFGTGPDKGGNFPFTLSAIKSSGEEVSLVIDYAQIASPGYLNYTAPVLFTDIVSLTIENSSSTLLSLDNITVSTVPIPAAVWLFGSALAGLGWMRRRKTA
jgi:hypothetical protein